MVFGISGGEESMKIDHIQADRVVSIVNSTSKNKHSIRKVDSFVSSAICKMGQSNGPVGRWGILRGDNWQLIA